MRPAVSRDISARAARDISNSGGPLSPPASSRRASTSPAGRATVVLQMMIPSTPVSTVVAAISASSSGARSGAILTSRGAALPASVAFFASIAASITRRSRAPCCKSRSPGVFGEDRLRTRKSARPASAAVHSAISAMGSVLSRLMPILAPTGPGCGARARRAASRRANISSPPLLNPSRLISARSASSRNRLGRGLPGCGLRVTVPASTNPKPSASSASTASAFLSNPAANPIGLAKSRFHTRQARIASSTSRDGGTSPSLRAPMAAAWASFGGRNSSSLVARRQTSSPGNPRFRARPARFMETSEDTAIPGRVTGNLLIAEPNSRSDSATARGFGNH